MCFCLKSVKASIPDCTTVPANISYVKEDCFNATHRSVQSGQCVNGVRRDEQVILTSCRQYEPVAGVSLSTAIDFYCHECEDRRVICSELEGRAQACAAHVNDDTFCRQVESIGSLSGCLSLTNYFTAIEYCAGDDNVPDAAITPHTCSDEYGDDFYRCISCGDGLRVCAGTDAEECEDIGLALVTVESNTTDGESEGDSAIDDSEEYSSFDCSQFWGDIQFYGEECFNETHRIKTSGLCVGGQVQGLSVETTPCSTDSDGMRYCHKCQGKPVCANTPEKSNICDENDAIRSCSTDYDRSSHWAGCKDEVSAYTVSSCVSNKVCSRVPTLTLSVLQTYFTQGSDSCQGGLELLSQQTLRCGDQFQGFPFCISMESDNYQLCSTVPLLPPPPIHLTQEVPCAGLILAYSAPSASVAASRPVAHLVIPARKSG